MSSSRSTRIEERIARWVPPQILELKAYRVADASGLVKLDAMESPYGIQEDLQNEWLERLRRVNVNRYPDPQARELKSSLRRVFNIPDSQELMLGNGSDEILQLIQIAVGGQGRSIMSPQPSFSMYEIIARYTQGNFVPVNLNSNFELSRNSLISAVKEYSPACLLISYPNNPTGNLFEAGLIEEAARIMDGLVVVDEAYSDYAEHSMLQALPEFENLVIVRTLSKSGLAGIRLGYLVGGASWLAEFEKLRLPYNVDVLSYASALFALEHWDDFKAQTQKILAERERLIQALEKFPELIVYPSQTNFVTVRLKTRNAGEVFQQFKSNGILIKNLDGSHALLANCLRITVGTPSENNEVCEVFKRII